MDHSACYNSVLLRGSLALGLGWSLDGKGKNIQDQRILSLWIRRCFSALSDLCTTSLRPCCCFQEVQVGCTGNMGCGSKGRFSSLFSPASTNSPVLVLAIRLSLPSFQLQRFCDLFPFCWLVAVPSPKDLTPIFLKAVIVLFSSAPLGRQS